MAEERSPQNYNFAAGLSNIPVAATEASDIEKYQDVFKDQVAALEQRYQNPNWFKVAAGFAKPQLGGFLASLGSASEALGENVEQQRAQMLPISQMKTQIAQANMLIAAKQKQNDLYQKIMASGIPTAQDLSAVIAMGPDTEVGKAAGQHLTRLTEAQNIKIQAGEAALKNPFQDFSDTVNMVLTSNKNPDDRAAADKAKLNIANLQKKYESPPPNSGIDPQSWAQMSTYDKMRKLNDLSVAELNLRLDEDQKLAKQSSIAQDTMPTLRIIRELALGQGIKDVEKKDAQGNPIKYTGQQQMSDLLGMFGGNNPIEVIGRAIADGKGPELLRNFDGYVRQYQMSPEVRPHFEKLIKELARLQVDMRSSSTNPTDQYQQLQSMSSPNISNSQNALVSIIDLIGHEQRHAIDKYRFVRENNLPALDLPNNKGYQELNKSYQDEKARIASSNPLDVAPRWYDPSFSNDKKKQESANVPPSTSAAPGKSESSKPLSNTIKGSNGNIWERKGNGWVDTGRKG